MEYSALWWNTVLFGSGLLFGKKKVESSASVDLCKRDMTPCTGCHNANQGPLLLYSIVIFWTSAFVAWLIHESRALFIVLGTLLEWLLFIEYSALSDLCICDMTHSWESGSFYRTQCCPGLYLYNVVLFWTGAYVAGLIHQSRALL